VIVKQSIDLSTLWLALSSGGTRGSHQVGALRYLAEVKKIPLSKIGGIVANSTGAASAAFAMVGRFDDMYDWARLFDNPKFISAWRLLKGPTMDINVLVDEIFRVQAPNLESEVLATQTKYFFAGTRFPDLSRHWFSRTSGEPLFEQLRAAKTMSAVCDHWVDINGVCYGDGRFSTRNEDLVTKAFAEGAEHVVLIDCETSGRPSFLTRKLLQWRTRNAPQCIKDAVESFCLEDVQAFMPTSNVQVLRPERLPTRHPLVRSYRTNRASIKQGYADAARLRFNLH
jgi:predicted patatin/cPLA2 family phospholipase